MSIKYFLANRHCKIISLKEVLSSKYSLRVSIFFSLNAIIASLQNIFYPAKRNYHL